MKHPSIVFATILLSLVTPAVAQEATQQAFLSLQPFECTRGASECTVNQSLYSSLKDALQASGKVRIFENVNFADLVLSGAIVDVNRTSLTVFFVTETTVKVKVSAELKDPVTSETVWSGSFDGEAKASSVNFPGIEAAISASTSQAAASVAQQIVNKMLSDPAFKGYLTHQPGERPIGRQPAPPAQPTVPSQQNVGQGAVQVVHPSGPALDGNLLAEQLVMHLKTLNFNGINSLLTDDYTNVFTLEGLQKQITPEAIQKASSVQYRYQYQAQSPELGTLNLAYTLPGQVEKVISLTVIDGQKMPITNRSGPRILYFPPTSPYAMVDQPFFKTSIGGINQLLSDLKSSAGLN